MTEIKKEIKQNDDGNYTITDAHSTADIVRWLLTQDSKETILYLLNEVLAQPERKPLTDEQICPWFQENTALTNKAAMRITRAIEAAHGIKE